MAADPYTHNFIYRIGDGGNYMIGEAEFNHDKKASYRMKQWSEPIGHDVMTAFIGFIDRVKERYEGFDGIKNVQIIEKGYNETYEFD